MTNNETVTEEPEHRPRRSLLPWMVLLAGVFAALYIVSWLATRYDGDTLAVQPETIETAITVAPETTVPETTTAAPETTVPETTTAAPETTVPIQTIGEIVRVSPDNFSTLGAVAADAGFGEALDGPGPLTVFAPTNTAFAAVDPDTLDALLADPDLLTPTIAHHVVEGTWTAADLVGLETITTVSGEDLSIRVDGDAVLVGDVLVTAPDIEASNGVIHVIDGVLVPQSVSSALTADAVTNLLTLEPIQFADSSAEITSASVSTLESALALLDADPGANLEIAGHTDDTGPADGNLRLSQRRADAVRDWLVANGVAADRLTAVGYGETLPVADNGTTEGRALNRRIEFVAQ